MWGSGWRRRELQLWLLGVRIRERLWWQRGSWQARMHTHAPRLSGRVRMTLVCVRFRGGCGVWERRRPSKRSCNGRMREK